MTAVRRHLLAPTTAAVAWTSYEHESAILDDVFVLHLRNLSDDTSAINPSSTFAVKK